MDTHRGPRRLLALALALAALSWAPPPARAAVAAVDEVGTSFEPPDIRVAVNDRVVWTNRSSQSHTVTFAGGPGDLHPNCDPAALALLRTGCQAPGSSVAYTFTRAGTYPYYCKIHANAAPPMRGVVVVTATTTTSASTSSSSSKSSSTTATTLKVTSSTTATTRPLATSSTIIRSTTTTTSNNTSVLLPGEPPSIGGGDASNVASRSGDSNADSRTVALIVALLLGVSVGGGFLLWRLRPGRP